MCDNNKTGIIWLVCWLLGSVLSTTRAVADEFMAYEVDPDLSVKTAPKQAAERWKDDRFGLFIHWGPISQMPEVFSLQEFLITVQGYIPGFAVLFGILIPLLSIGLVFLQVQRNSYHLALNLLYPTLVSVLIAEILFKYYLFQYGIVL